MRVGWPAPKFHRWQGGRGDAPLRVVFVLRRLSSAEARHLVQQRIQPVRLRRRRRRDTWPPVSV
jgi:hypothetical protein